jgi:tripartite-type tricarboxylate transporter receptor subunit TctC
MRLRLVLGCLIALWAVGAAAQSYPTKPIRLVVPFPPGSTTDLVGRILAHRLTEAVGQQVIVDNRAGAGGVVGTEAVARALPDGYTLLMGTIGTHAINASLYKQLPYDPVADFAPVAQFGTAPNVLVVHPALPVQTLAELVEHAKRRPGQLNYASSGSGTSNHLSGALFGARAGVEVVHVPYRGGAEAIRDLIRGEVAFMFYHYLPLLPHIREGTMRPLAVTAAERIQALPAVPTMGEAGMADFVVSAWFGVYAPARSSAAIVEKLNGAIASILRDEAVRESLIAQGIDPVTGSPAELAALMKDEISRWARVVEVSGARVD